MKAKYLIRAIFVAVMAATAIFSCTKTPAAELTVNPTSLNVSGDGASETVRVSTPGQWTAKSDADWVTLDPAKETFETWDGSVTVIVAKNTTGKERKAGVRFSAGSLSVTLSVTQAANEPEPVPGDGSKEHPYSVKEATTLIASGKYVSDPVYVFGYVSHINDIASTDLSEYGNASYYISDDGGLEGELYVFHGFGLNGAKFTNQDELKVGSKVVVKGALTNYNGTYEITSNNELYSVDESTAKNPKPAGSTAALWLELPATSDADGLYFVSHTMKVADKSTRNYSIYYDKTDRISVWVAYPLSKWNKGSSVSRTDIWGYDTEMPVSWQPSLAKAFAAGNKERGDRGHQIPSADRYSNYEANAQTFFYVNMTAQANSFNAGIWGSLESTVRGWSSNSDTLYVVTGCCYKDSQDFNYDNYGHKVPMPNAYFKTALYKKGNNYGAIAVYLETTRTGSVQKGDYMSIDALEAKTGIDFYKNLSNAVGEAKAAEIEAADPAKDSFWGI